MSYNKAKLAVTYGRWNPITNGHVKLISELRNHERYLICLSETHGKKNPLTPEEKLHYLELLAGENGISSKNIISLLQFLHKSGECDLVFILGEDRCDFISKLLESDHADCRFIKEMNISLKLVKRTASDESATKNRKFVLQDNFYDFSRNTPGDEYDKLQLFKLLKERKNFLT